MAAATTTIHEFPSDGAYIARGIASAVNNADTIDTGLLNANGFLATARTADTVVNMTSQSAGVVTVSAHTAGAAVGGGVTVSWIAWQLPTST